MKSSFSSSSGSSSSISDFLTLGNSLIKCLSSAYDSYLNIPFGFLSSVIKYIGKKIIINIIIPPGIPIIKGKLYI